MVKTAAMRFAHESEIRARLSRDALYLLSATSAGAAQRWDRASVLLPRSLAQRACKLLLATGVELSGAGPLAPFHLSLSMWLRLPQRMMVGSQGQMPWEKARYKLFCLLWSSPGSNFCLYSLSMRSWSLRLAHGQWEGDYGGTSSPFDDNSVKEFEDVF